MAFDLKAFMDGLSKAVTDAQAPKGPGPNETLLRFGTAEVIVPATGNVAGAVTAQAGALGLDPTRRVGYSVDGRAIAGGAAMPGGKTVNVATETDTKGR